MKLSGKLWKGIATGSGLAIVALTFFDDFIFESWMISFPVIFGIGGLFLTLCILGMLRQNNYYFKLFVFGSLGILAGNLYDPEMFKSPRTLEAELVDDLSRMTLILRNNNNFELSSQDLFSTQVYSGKYVRNNNQIIFLSRPYDNDFIPDTVNIINDKIILRSVEGVPDTSFASYFQIQQLP
jgi:hypothetical protein